MPDPQRPIIKSAGLTDTEKSLSDLCDRTFLKLWSYANPFRATSKELCDLIAVFDNHVFLFFDREIRVFHNSLEDFSLAWSRWKKEAIDKQIKSARRARNHVKNYPDKIYLDAKCEQKLPIAIWSRDIIVHTIIVANGAAEACKNYSPDNISGSLAVCYFDAPNSPDVPFTITLPRTELVHVFDSNTAGIILREFDTFYDFTAYITAKEAAIRKYDFLTYCGEEDLVAHYYMNYDEPARSHFIGASDPSVNGIIVPEGNWAAFEKSGPYKRKKLADQESYFWDELLQQTSQNALDGKLQGDGGIFSSNSAIFEMAKEPRFFRRAISTAIREAVRNFPETQGLSRNLSFLPSFYKDKAYVFLQVRHPNIVDYENDYRPKRMAILEIACGVARNKFPHLKKVIGIAIDAAKFTRRNSEDFILLKCDDWTEENRAYYEELNLEFGFFESSNQRRELRTVRNFPEPRNPKAPKKPGRNEACFCGSGKKYKKCCGGR
jgi:hypothetical protein